MTASELSREITQYVVQRHEALIRRFFPDWTLPAFFAGFRAARQDAADFAYNLAHLHSLGVGEIAGTPVKQAMTTMLRQVDGPRTITFWSYRVAEALAAFGRFEGNPLLAGLSAADVDNVRAATDSTSIYDPAKQTLGGFPNNYWGVLARCEFARQRLGILQDDSLLDRTLTKAEAALFASESGYLDDDPNGSGRYDIYSPDTYLFLEPLWSRFDQAKLWRGLLAQTRLAEKAVLENGASIAWGRSIGALSVCLTMELNAAALKLGIAADPARSLALVGYAFEKFKGWIADDLISAHRYRHTYKYRGPHRLLGMTLDCLGKLLYTAKCLAAASSPSAGTPGEGSGGAASTGEGQPKLFPPVDELIPFDDRNAAVWLYRNDKLAFHLPIVSSASADYVPWPHSPGLLENPVDSHMVAGVPRVAAAGAEYTISGRADRIEKSAHTITLHYSKLTTTAKEPATLPCCCSIAYRIDGDAVHGQLEMNFDNVPDGIGVDIPETAARPLAVRADTGRHTVVDLQGSPPFRSFWGELKRWHQIDLTPAKSVKLSYTVRPAIRVMHIPAEHDYNRALYDAMPAGEVVEVDRRGSGNCYSQMNDLRRFLGDADILHVGWPEHLFSPHGLAPEDFDQRMRGFLEKLAASGKKIVWTMHNRLPHYWDHERGQALYRAWAPVVDGVIHHSRCGMERMRREVPFKPTARHVVIPHGHFGAMMPRLDRAALEDKLSLGRCAMRFGLLGRPQKEKQFDLIARAFVAAGREDQQLVVTVNAGDPPPVDHPRVKTLVREGFLTRQQVSEHNQVCDVLVAAHTGDTYLTSGIPADAIGLGLAMFVPEWAYFREHLGDAAVYHDNTEATLTELFRSFTPEQMREKQQQMLALQPQYAWPRLAKMTLDFFRTL